jgi:hypothetical protein
MVELLINCKEFGRKQRFKNVDTTPAFPFSDNKTIKLRSGYPMYQLRFDSCTP